MIRCSFLYTIILLIISLFNSTCSCSCFFLVPLTFHPFFFCSVSAFEICCSHLIQNELNSFQKIVECYKVFNIWYVFYVLLWIKYGFMRIADRMNSAFIYILHSVPIDFGIGALFYSNKNERKVQRFPVTVFFFHYGKDSFSWLHPHGTLWHPLPSLTHLLLLLMLPTPGIHL